MAKFDAQTFETVQNLVYPLIDALFDFNPADTVSDQAEHFANISAALEELSILFAIACDALTDGVLTADEIGEVITQAGSVFAAIEAIGDAFSDAEDDESSSGSTV